MGGGPVRACLEGCVGIFPIPGCEDSLATKELKPESTGGPFIEPN